MRCLRVRSGKVSRYCCDTPVDWDMLTSSRRTAHRSVRSSPTTSPTLNRPLVRATLMEIKSLPIVRPKPGERAPPIKTQARSATILPNFVGLVFQVHNGKIYHDVRITEDMVGHKLGEFSP